MVSAIFIVTTLGLSMGLLFGLASRHFAVEGNPLRTEIEALLPGSQCGQCVYPGCPPAAEALANGEAPVSELDLRAEHSAGNVAERNLSAIWRDLLAARRSLMEQLAPDAPELRIFQP